jgi:Nucleotidyl transferase AbiEii toxin, Type IV TA system
MHPEILEGPQKSLLAVLGRAGIPPALYLAGGTALALHLGHRKSVDLDFFHSEKFEAEEFLTVLQRIGEFQVRRSDPGTLTARVEGVEVSFVRYQYPMLDSPMKVEFGPPIAQVRDIACMKLSAIMARGSRRDFVDLYGVCQHGDSLEAVYGWFQQKYRGISYDPYHLARSLVYFLDAEEERMPVMLRPYRWDEVKAFFVRESQRVFGG